LLSGGELGIEKDCPDSSVPAKRFHLSAAQSGLRFLQRSIRSPEKYGRANEQTRGANHITDIDNAVQKWRCRRKTSVAVVGT
jgi:hypothetical protein